MTIDTTMQYKKKFKIPLRREICCQTQREKVNHVKSSGKGKKVDHVKLGDGKTMTNRSPFF